jgi:antitoxin component of RelBE/YafQ-DinJ toxin-antitoxin module
MEKLDDYIRVRVPKELKEEFEKTCKKFDSDISRELRIYMKQFIAKNKSKSLLDFTR